MAELAIVIADLALASKTLLMEGVMLLLVRWGQAGNALRFLTMMKHRRAPRGLA